MARVCSDCPREISLRGKSGLCRSCICRRNFGSPEVQAKAAAGLRRHLADPVARARLVQRSLAQLEAWRATPEGAASVRAQARINISRAHRPENKARRVHGIRAAAYPGIPEHRWDECVELTQVVGSAEAKRMIRADERMKQRAAEANLTPFERQLARVAAGAGICAKPDTRRTDPAITLGGVASASL